MGTRHGLVSMCSLKLLVLQVKSLCTYRNNTLCMHITIQWYKSFNTHTRAHTHTNYVIKSLFIRSSTEIHITLLNCNTSLQHNRISTNEITTQLVTGKWITSSNNTAMKYCNTAMKWLANKRQWTIAYMLIVWSQSGTRIVVGHKYGL